MEMEGTRSVRIEVEVEMLQFMVHNEDCMGVNFSKWSPIPILAQLLSPSNGFHPAGESGHPCLIIGC